MQCLSTQAAPAGADRVVDGEQDVGLGARARVLLGRARHLLAVRRAHAAQHLCAGRAPTSKGRRSAHWLQVFCFQSRV